MTKAELRKVVDKHTTCLNDFHAILTAVDAYSSALLQQTPCTTQLPPTCEGCGNYAAQCTCYDNSKSDFLAAIA